MFYDLHQFACSVTISNKGYPHCYGIMQALKRRLSFRKKKDRVLESSKPHQWQEDEKKVRAGTCSFQVRVSAFPSSVVVGCPHIHMFFGGGFDHL